VRRRSWRKHVYYFDLASWSVSLIIALGLVAGRRELSAWLWTQWAALAVFIAMFAALAILRETAYSQRIPWLVTAFSLAALTGLIVTFSSWKTLWFMMVLAVGAAIIAAGAASRRKALDQRLSRQELFALAALAASVLFGVMVLELLVRLGSGLLKPELRELVQMNPANYGVAHPYIGHLHTPHSSFVMARPDFEAVHHVDGLGFRNRWPWPEQAEIVVVGDSVSFGYTAADDQAWPAQLERSLGGPRVVNLSLVGAGPQQYLRIFETFGVKLHPKLLLVGVWAANDFADAATFDGWERSGIGGNDMVWRDFGRPERRAPVSFRHPIASLEGIFRHHFYPLLRRSYLYNLVWALRGGWGDGTAVSTITMPFPDGGRLQLRAGPSHAVVAGRADRREFQLLLKSLIRVNEIAKEQGARTLMVLQPAKEEVYLPLVSPDSVDLTADLRRAFDQHGIEYLDLGSPLREEARAGARLYREVDGHPNEAGYALIAELVRRHVEQHKIAYGLTN
jgi:lysophospholipase L1-like esterase